MVPIEETVAPKLRWMMAHYGRRVHLVPTEQSEHDIVALCGEKPTFNKPWHVPYVAPVQPQRRCPMCEELATLQGYEIPDPALAQVPRPQTIPPGAQPPASEISDEAPLVLECPGDTGEHAWARLPIKNGYHYCPACWTVGPPRLPQIH